MRIKLNPVERQDDGSGGDDDDDVSGGGGDDVDDALHMRNDSKKSFERQRRVKLTKEEKTKGIRKARKWQRYVKMVHDSIHLAPSTFCLCRTYERVLYVYQQTGLGKLWL